MVQVVLLEGLKMAENGRTEADSNLPDRLRGMIWGQLVGDAAALGTHWIYNLSELAASYPKGVNGFEEPKEGHYHFGKKPGDQTHYGDAALVLLESVAEEGQFDQVKFGRAFVERLNPETYQGYVDHSTRGTVESKLSFEELHPSREFDFQQGADDDQLATATSIGPAIAAHLGHPDLMVIVENVTRVRQNNDRSIAYMKAHVRILLELLKGRDIHSSLHRVEEIAGKDVEFGPELRRKFRSAFELLSRSVEEATDKLGQSCPLISSFPSALHGFLHYRDSFDRAILDVIRAGGDNAGRAAMVGAWLGTHLGIEAIPEGWRRRLTKHDAIDGWVERIVEMTERRNDGTTELRSNRLAERRQRMGNS